MLGAFKGSPQKALELEAALPPPGIRFEKQCDMYALRTLKFQKTHPISQVLGNNGVAIDISNISNPGSVTQLWSLFNRIPKIAMGAGNIEKIAAEWEAPWTTFPAEFVVSTLSKAEEKVVHEETLPRISAESKNAMIFYTDGSQKNACASAGLCQIGENSAFSLLKSWNLGGGMEIADAEVFAIAKALHFAAKNPRKCLKTVHIFVDSQAAMARLQNCMGNQIIQRALKAAAQLQRTGVHVRIQWCPSHIGISGNEMADRLAKKGLESPNISCYAYTSLGHLKRLAKQQIRNAWHDSWYYFEEKEEVSGRNTGLGGLYRRISKENLAFTLRPRPTIINLPKNTISAYIQLKTGKGLLKSFQHIIRKAPNDKCSCSARKRQDTRHLLMECELYSSERIALRRQLKPIPLGLHTLFCTAKGHIALSAFLQNTGICTVGWMNHAGL